MSGDNEQHERGLNADLLELYHVPFEMLLDIQRALAPIFVRWDDDVPHAVSELAEVVDLEIGRRNEINYLRALKRAASDDAKEG